MPSPELQALIDSNPAYWAKVHFVADKAAETHKKIKALRSTKMSNQAQRDAIKAEQDKWWDEARPLMTRYEPEDQRAKG